ncbi:hypothetical protein G210_4280 [Candida maltosa Xu316]|uniref:Cyclin n=1 Tax=Candida maltosa (strain Xu316) TaxID=1245528 RepID=M3IGY6_CANMX|nr:hypothetical protein G210_4280 [Candida maltosa Xu316]
MTSQYNNNFTSTTIDSTTQSSGPTNGLSSSSMSTPTSSFHKPQVSNLTKNLLSSSGHNTPVGATSSTSTTPTQSNHNHQLSANPSSSFTEQITNKFLPNSNVESGSFHSGSFQHSHHPHGATINDSIHYIPSSHNTPTAISNSYSSHHSYNASLPSVNNFITQPQQFSSSSFKPPSVVPNPIPTTNVHNDTANRTTTTINSTSVSSSSSFTQPSSFTSVPIQQNSFQQRSLHQQQQQDRFPNSLPSAGGLSHFAQPQQPPPPLQSRQSYNNKFQSQPPVVTETQVHTSGSTTPVESESQNVPPATSTTNQRPHVRPFHSTSSLPKKPHHSQPPPPPQQQQQAYVPPEPDHYMTYSEFLQNLTEKDKQEGSANADQQHLNIVEYPVNDLIVMLSCLLTKIIEANDKLHPNHFENTIAIRQKLKEEKRLKKLQKKQKLQQQQQQQQNDDDIDVDRNDDVESGNDVMDQDQDERTGADDIDDDGEEDEDEEDDDEEDDEDDEMKNKYLANVLAFHGTNVPGISLQAYLARVLKYCPVTNEVFLSLLVYFDRIAKKANNLNQKKKSSHNSGNSEDASNGEAEQLFVMDSYNIHRLIISGITVSSKFFSDIFYKNLRYAKVGGLPLEELNYLELQFLLLLDFKLMISVEDLQNYGDLLLRFWKREQVANELVPNEIKEQK